MIAIQNIIDRDKSLLTIKLDQSVLKHLRCKCDDYVCVLQSNFKPSLFLMVKSENGYRIRRDPALKRIYEINIAHPYKFMEEFNLRECTYFLKKNATLRIKIED
jgi:hypothetical protein